MKPKTRNKVKTAKDIPHATELAKATEGAKQFATKLLEPRKIEVSIHGQDSL